MFTVKLLRSSPSKGRRLIEAEEVTLNVIRPNEFTQILADGKKFNVVNPAKIKRASDMLPDDPLPTDMELWTEAYVENSSGATTDQVKFTS